MQLEGSSYVNIILTELVCLTKNYISEQWPKMLLKS